MAKARKILKHVKAIKNIRTVTKTMEMIATSRFKKMHNRVVGARPYTDKISGLVGDIIQRSREESLSHPLLRPKGDLRRDVLLVITSNRGLCGAYNSSVLRMAIERRRQLVEARYEVKLHAVGKRGINYMKFRGLELDGEYPDLAQSATYDQIRALADNLMARFLNGQISGLEVAYMQYISSGRQKAAIAQIMPLSFIEAPKRWVPGGTSPGVYELVPAAQDVLDALLPAAVRLRIYQCFLDAMVSEQVMRIASMRAATDNADDMIHDLTVLYNRTRQSQITTELSEIMGGRAGME